MLEYRCEFYSLLTLQTQYLLSLSIDRCAGCPLCLQKVVWLANLSLSPRLLEEGLTHRFHHEKAIGCPAVTRSQLRPDCQQTLSRSPSSPHSALNFSLTHFYLRVYLAKTYTQTDSPECPRATPPSVSPSGSYRCFSLPLSWASPSRSSKATSSATRRCHSPSRPSSAESP
jgi:hypothetical protein